MYKDEYESLVSRPILSALALDSAGTPRLPRTPWCALVTAGCAWTDTEGLAGLPVGQYVAWERDAQREGALARLLHGRGS